MSKRGIFPGEVANWGPPVGFMAAVLLLWQFAVASGPAFNAILPSPSQILDYLGSHLGLLFQEAVITTLQALASLAFAALIGASLGSLLYVSTLARETLYPFVLVAQVLPKVALAPLFVMWFGTGEAARIAFGAFLSFFPVLLSTLAGLEQSDRNAVRLCRSLNATEAQTFWMVRVPFALPQVFAGLKVAATLAMTGVVIGEFMTADSGLGFLIVSASSQANERAMLAAIAVLCLSGLAIFGGVSASHKAFNAWRFGRRSS